MSLSLVNEYQLIYNFGKDHKYTVKAELALIATIWTISLPLKGARPVKNVTCKSDVLTIPSGYVLRSITLKKGKLRTDITEACSDGKLSIFTKARTTGSGYRKLCSFWVETVQSLRNRLQESDVHSLNSEEALPKPFKFSPETYIKDGHFNDGSYFRSTSQMSYVHVLGVVTIVNGKVQNDSYRPGATCWFMLEGAGHNAATFTIVTDGEEYYVTERVRSVDSPARIKPNGNSGKVTLDLTKANLTDKEIVNAAILEWVSKIS